ncbi:MAG: hypothetical protein II949_12945 [Prevotella sp.]|nr:hypothetical protein [Prevotella sp.]
MKQRILFTAAVLLGMAAAASTTSILTTAPQAAAEEVAIDESSFPDANFRQYVLDSIDSNNDSFLSTAEAEAVEEINVADCSISDLTGIGFFSKLKILLCNNALEETNTRNHLTTLDVSKNTELVRLACGQNEIASLDLSNNINLENLHCANNKLSAIDVSHQPKLWRLYCAGNQLTSIDVSHNPELTELNCYNAQLTSLDLSNCQQMVTLYCYNNQLASLDVSNCQQLVTLCCYNNQLTSLDVTNCKQIKTLYCYNNQLTSLDVTNCPELDALACYDNQLSSLDIKNCKQMKSLWCNNNNLASLDMSGCPQLARLFCYNNQLASLDVSGCPQLATLYCYNNQLASIDVTKCPDLTYFYCYGNKLTSLDVTKCSRLKCISCFSNNLTSLDVSDCSQLDSLWCYYNRLASLDVSGCPQLINLQCYDNYLTTLDVSGCPQLTYFYCFNNELASIDVTNCPELIYFYCNNNELTTLDVSNNPNLYYLYCCSNKIAGKGMDALITSLVDMKDAGYSPILILYSYDDETEQNYCTKKQVEVITNKGWTAATVYEGYLYFFNGFDDDTEVVVVSDLAEYTGNAPFVYNEADGKVYALNNLNEYEEYGIYEKSATLKVAEGDTEIEYIETKTTGNHPYINTGYIFKENTRIVVDCDLTENSVKKYEAVFGARHGVTDDAFVFFSRFSNRNSGCYARNQEVAGSVALPMNQRITIEAEGNQATIYTANSSEPYTTISCTATVTGGREEMYVFDMNNGGSRDNSWAFMKLYGFKIYEGQELVMDLKPIVSATGKGGLVDKVSGQRFFSADPALSFALSPDGEAVANDLGITVYEGKLVVNTTDGNLYKYSHGEFTSMGKVTLTPIANDDYKDLRNWQTNDDHKIVFEGKIAYDEQTGLNKVENFAGIGFFEPLMIKIPTTTGDDYNYSFVYSGSPYTSWHGVEMHAYVTNAYDLATEESALACGGDILATCALPFGGATDMKVSLDFTAAQDTETLVYQFGDVEDGDKGYWFHFGQLLVQKYNYPATYPDLMADDEGVKGDVNGDGEVGIGDIVAITNVMAGIESDPDVTARADVNDDGEVGIGDIVAITNIMAGIK